jgi:hypothetical protein
MRFGIAVGVAAVAVFAGVIYFTREKSPTAPADKPAATAPRTEAAKAKSAVPQPVPRSPGTVADRPAVSDPRLAALMHSADDDLIEFIKGPDGKVIKEISKDPSSPGFGKPLREYTYSGNRVVGLVSYEYLGDRVQVHRAAVSYKPDGSVDQYRESTD